MWWEPGLRLAAEGSPVVPCSKAGHRHMLSGQYPEVTPGYRANVLIPVGSVHVFVNVTMILVHLTIIFTMIAAYPHARYFRTTLELKT